MKITENQLRQAVEEKIISEQQAEALLGFFQAQPATEPGFNFTNILYYAGGLIAIGAMTLFMNLGWESFGGWGILFISLIYAGIGIVLVEQFRAKMLAIPAGICGAFVVALTPLAMYGLQHALGYWPDDTPYQDYHRYIKWHWIFLEFATLIVGVVMIWKYKYPFLVMPIAITLWYMSMDFAAMLIGKSPEFELHQLVSMYFGLFILILAVWVDIRSKNTGDYAFWLYIVGVLAFWGGMTMQHSDSELSKLVYFCVNLLMIGIGVILIRRVFVIFGGIGSAVYLGHLASNVFADSWLFPVALSAIGFLIIYMGVLWQKHEKVITEKSRKLLPSGIAMLLNDRAR